MTGYLAITMTLTQRDVESLYTQAVVVMETDLLRSPSVEPHVCQQMGILIMMVSRNLYVSR